MSNRPMLTPAVFRNLRDRPSFNTENWLARRIFRHAGLGVKARTKLRFALAEQVGSNEEWDCAKRVARTLRWLDCGDSKYVGDIICMREDKSTRAVEWYRESILPSTESTPPHLMFRSLANTAEVVYPVPTYSNIGYYRMPYMVAKGITDEVVLVVQRLTEYLGQKQNTPNVLSFMFAAQHQEVPPEILALVNSEPPAAQEDDHE